MFFLAFCRWLQDTGPSRAISESIWGYPIVGAVHVLGMVLFGLAGLLVDLRLLGVILQSERVSRVAEGSRLWQRTGLVVLLLSGLLLFAASAVRSYNSTFFQIKMVLLALAGLNALIFRWQWRAEMQLWDADFAPPAGARRSAAFAVVLWVCIVFASRGIAYF